MTELPTLPSPPTIKFPVSNTQGMKAPTADRIKFIAISCSDPSFGLAKHNQGIIL